MSDGLNDMVPPPLGAVYPALHPCRPRRSDEAVIRKHAPSLLPGDCINAAVPHECKLPPEPEPLPVPRPGSYVRVRWLHYQGLMLVFESREHIEPWESDDSGHDSTHEGPTLFLNGWVFEEGKPRVSAHGRGYAAEWHDAVPHESHAITNHLRWSPIDA